MSLDWDNTTFDSERYPYKTASLYPEHTPQVLIQALWCKANDIPIFISTDRSFDGSCGNFKKFEKWRIEVKGGSLYHGIESLKEYGLTLQVCSRFDVEEEGATERLFELEKRYIDGKMSDPETSKIREAYNRRVALYIHKNGEKNPIFRKQQQHLIDKDPSKKWHLVHLDDDLKVSQNLESSLHPDVGSDFAVSVIHLDGRKAACNLETYTNPLAQFARIKGIDLHQFAEELLLSSDPFSDSALFLKQYIAILYLCETGTDFAKIDDLISRFFKYYKYNRTSEHKKLYKLYEFIKLEYEVRKAVHRKSVTSEHVLNYSICAYLLEIPEYNPLLYNFLFEINVRKDLSRQDKFFINNLLVSALRDRRFELYLRKDFVLLDRKFRDEILAKKFFTFQQRVDDEKKDERLSASRATEPMNTDPEQVQIPDLLRALEKDNLILKITFEEAQAFLEYTKRNLKNPSERLYCLLDDEPKSYFAISVVSFPDISYQYTESASIFVCPNFSGEGTPEQAKGYAQYDEQQCCIMKSPFRVPPGKKAIEVIAENLYPSTMTARCLTPSDYQQYEGIKQNRIHPARINLTIFSPSSRAR